MEHVFFSDSEESMEEEEASEEEKQNLKIITQQIRYLENMNYLKRSRKLLEVITE